MEIDHSFRFRWASMELQYLCSFRIDADIQNSLGRLPPDLHTLYGEIYEVISTTPGELEAKVFKNVLCWLLCAQRTLHTEEFLVAVSINLDREYSMNPISKDLVLELCNNFVILDSQLDTFRFAHLSVREFLETRREYDNSTSNRLFAEVCVWSTLVTDDGLPTADLLCQIGLRAKPPTTQFELLSAYADTNWPLHCKSAGTNREFGALKPLLRYILNATSILAR